LAPHSIHNGCCRFSNCSFKFPYVLALEMHRNLWRSSMGSSGIRSLEERAESRQTLCLVLRYDRDYVSWGCGRHNH
jgi:hypothetical protein